MSLPGIERLTREWERLRARYHITEAPPEIARLQLGVVRRQAKIRHLRSRIEELSSEIRVLESELAGLEKIFGLVLGEAIEEARSSHGEVWSPVQVLGFRIWDVAGGRLHGYRECWDRPWMTARCPTTGDNFEVPHTDGRCGEPPCGIYAAKDVEVLLEAHADLDLTEIAVGLVGMTGKVVEHEHGYRAEHVTVLALALLEDGEVRTVSDPEEIESLFEEVRGGGEAPVEDGIRVRTRVVEFMREQFEKESQWTLASRNG
jgi:hypothetical protein